MTGKRVVPLKTVFCWQRSYQCWWDLFIDKESISIFSFFFHLTDKPSLSTVFVCWEKKTQKEHHNWRSLWMTKLELKLLLLTEKTCSVSNFFYWQGTYFCRRHFSFDRETVTFEGFSLLRVKFTVEVLYLLTC